MTTDLGPLLDLDTYPVLGVDDPIAAPFFAESAATLAADGVLVLPGFVRAEVLPAMIAEAEALEPLASPQDIEGTPYLGLPDDTYPEGHPRRAVSRNALTAIAYDLFPADSSLRAIYKDDRVMRFVGAVLDRWPLYRYADPFGALNVAVMRDGDELGWHFDQTDFVVSIALQSSIAGGDFENAANLRDSDDERYDDVAAVLDGAAPERVRHEPMTPGTLMVFMGRHSMHRVTPIVGPRPRHVALLAYDTEPGTDSSELLKLVRYGRLPGDPVPS